MCEVLHLRRSAWYHNENPKLDQWNILPHDNYKKEDSVENIDLNQQQKFFNNPFKFYYEALLCIHQLGIVADSDFSYELRNLVLTEHAA